MSRSGALDRIDVLLSTITDPAFAAVIRAEPLALSGTPVLAYWIQSRTNGWQPLGDIGSTTTIMVSLLTFVWLAKSTAVETFPVKNE